MQMDDGHLEQLYTRQVTEIIDAEPTHAELIFHVGEKVKVKDGDFRIKSIGRKMMVLEGLPGTRIAP